MKIIKWSFVFTSVLLIVFLLFWSQKKFNIFNTYTIGQPIDSLNGVIVYYNGPISNFSGRNTTPDHYNIGQKYQCVEFVKRYYYQYLKHKMPDSYGHAKDFFDIKVKDGAKNLKRNLIQYTNPSLFKPEVNDLVVYSGSHGHVAIISKVTDNEIEIIQQNPGPHVKSRIWFDIEKVDGKWEIDNGRILGWLRKE